MSLTTQPGGVDTPLEASARRGTTPARNPLIRRPRRQLDRGNRDFGLRDMGTRRILRAPRTGPYWRCGTLPSRSIGRSRRRQARPPSGHRTWTFIPSSDRSLVSGSRARRSISGCGSTCSNQDGSCAGAAWATSRSGRGRPSLGSVICGHRRHHGLVLPRRLARRLSGAGLCEGQLHLGPDRRRPEGFL
jgi:hypothetical protein